MIPTKNERVTTQSGAISGAAFQISSANGAAIMGILREGIYSDKPLAVLREYAANAWDAHRAAGRGDQPIEVTLPTHDSPVVAIRDRGDGLSHQQMFELFTQYGDSTKRGSNDAVGMMGIGSKSAFCYADSFTITSWHLAVEDTVMVVGGSPVAISVGRSVRRVYMAHLGEDDVGGISLVHEAPSSDPSETGLEIRVATRPEDKWEFESTARRLFQHFEPRPIINIALPDQPPERTVLQNGVIYPESGEWIAVMGCVPYKIDMSKIDLREVNPALAHMSGRLAFKIGEVGVSASRENLKYTAQTKAALVDRANALVDEYVLHALTELESGNVTGWAARLQVRVLQQLELPLPDQWRPLADAYAKVTYDPAQFTIVHNKSGCTRVVVEEGTRLLIDDTGSDLAGYDLDSEDYVVRATTPSTSAEDLRTMLDVVLASAGLVGIRVEKLSSLSWSAPSPSRVARQKGGKNPKHRAQMFRLIDGSKLPLRKQPKSDNWEAVVRAPDHEDVFVVIRAFQADADAQFWSDISEDRSLCEDLGVAFPTIHAYKSTERRPVLASQCVGTAYREWRKPFFEALMTDERRATLDQCWQADPEVHKPTAAELRWLHEKLGDAHPIVAMYEDVFAADSALTRANVDRDAMISLGSRCGLSRAGSWHDEHVKAVLAPYKLLVRSGVRELFRQSYYGSNEEERLEWAEYVKMVDAHQNGAR